VQSDGATVATNKVAGGGGAVRVHVHAGGANSPPENKK
jgi:hypothetical protein